MCKERPGAPHEEPTACQDAGMLEEHGNCEEKAAQSDDCCRVPRGYLPSNRGFGMLEGSICHKEKAQ